MTMKLLPPNSTGTDQITVNGRTYTTTNGTAIDVPDHDADVMRANGWYAPAPGGSGATASRPTNVPRNTVFFDSTLSALIVWDGKTWRNKTTGAAV
jgi:hypothetical protein